MNSPYNLVGVLNTLIRWRKPISFFIITAAIASTVVALLLPNYYESKSIIYPSNLAASDRRAMFGLTADMYMDYFGGKNEVNRLLTVANSAPLIDFAIAKFDLAKHYDIDSAHTKYWRYKVKKEFLDNFDVVKTEYGSVEITFEDKDPVFAANLVNTIVQQIDTLSKDLIANNKRKMVNMLYAQLQEKRDDVRKQSDSIAQISQAFKIEESLSPKGTGGVLVSGGTPQAREQYKVLHSRLTNSMNDLNNLTTLYDEHLASVEENASTLYVVEQAFPAERKSWPIRWLIVVATTLVALFLGLVGALLIDKVREIKAQLNA